MTSKLHTGPKSVTVTSKPGGRVIVIGDLQGCLEETLELLAKCHVTDDDRVIFAGDLVDRGPDSGGCIDLAMALEESTGSPTAILGNHEEKHLRYHEIDLLGQVPNVSAATHVATRLQLTADHYEYLARLPLIVKLPEFNAAVVHAGVYPGRSLDEQDPHPLLHLQMINPSGNDRTVWPSKVHAERDSHLWKFWTHFWDGSERIIFGHSVLDKPLVTDKVVGIDGGACFGRSLHALILPSWEIVSVEAQKDFGKGHRGTSSDSIRMFTVHGDVSTYS